MSSFKTSLVATFIHAGGMAFMAAIISVVLLVSFTPTLFVAYYTKNAFGDVFHVSATLFVLVLNTAVVGHLLNFNRSY